MIPVTKDINDRETMARDGEPDARLPAGTIDEVDAPHQGSRRMDRPPVHPREEQDPRHGVPAGVPYTYPYPYPQYQMSSGQYRAEMASRAQQKLKEDPPLLFPIVFLLVLGILASSFMYGVYADYRDDDTIIVEGIRIEEVFFILTGVKDDSIVVDITIYVTNIGNKDSGEINITAFAVRNDNSITYAQGSANIPMIPGENTQQTKISMELDKHRTFRIDIIAFEDHMIKETGYGKITTGEVNQTAVDFVSGEGGNAKEYGEEDSGAAMLGGGGSALCIFVPVIIVVLILIFNHTFGADGRRREVVISSSGTDGRKKEAEKHTSGTDERKMETEKYTSGTDERKMETEKHSSGSDARKKEVEK